MVFKKAPEQDTYSSERISLVNEINWRDGGATGKDEDYLNVFVETIRNKPIDDKRKYVVKRAGATTALSRVTFSLCRGMFFWADQNKIFQAVDDDIHIHDVNTGTVTSLSSVFGTLSGYVGFTEYLYDTNTTVVVATDGTTLVQIDSSNTLTTCVDADLPTPHLPYPVFLDGYLFLVKTNSADIYNSDLNDPMLWTAGNFVTAEMEGDYLQRIAKLNNYLLAFGTNSIEYFWDSGNSPGSPLQRNDTPIKINSYLGGWAQYGNEVFYIGRDSGGQPDVFLLKDFKITPVGSNSVSRYLNRTTDGSTAWHGNIVAFKGHVFYVLRAGDTKTFMCDVDTKFWTRIGFQSLNTFNINNAVSVKTNTTIKTYFTLNIADSIIYKFDDDTHQDVSSNFTCSIVTPPENFDTWNRKTMHRLTLLGDDPGSASNVLVQWTDDDYQTFNTGLNINQHADMPSIRRLGIFRERAFKLTYTDNYPFRVTEIEVDINKGNS